MISMYPWTRMYFSSNTHRPINVNGTELLGNNSTAVNFIDGTNTTVVGSGSDIQINATDAVDWVSNGILGAKNLNATPYYHSSGRVQNYVTWTVNDDGSITANGTASGGNSAFSCHTRTKTNANCLILPNGKYIFSGCPSGGSTSKYALLVERTYNGTAESLGIDTGDGVEITLNGDDYSNDEVVVQIICRVYNGFQASNLTFYPMIRLANDTDATWKPYAETNKELTDNKVSWVDNGLIGAKNLNSYPYYHDSRTINSVVWTVNADGSVTANGKATGGNSSFACHSRMVGYANSLILPNGDYIVNGCPSGGGSNKYRIEVTITKNGSYSTLALDTGEGAAFTINGDDNYNDKAQVQIVCTVYNGITVSNLTFYPMIRIADDNDDTWRPYAPTNRDLQLTKPNPEAIATVEYSPTMTNHSQGDLIMFNGNLYKCLSAITSGENLVAGTNIQQTNLVTEILAMISAL